MDVTRITWILVLGLIFFFVFQWWTGYIIMYNKQLERQSPTSLEK
jgi:hypothetical protein